LIQLNKEINFSLWCDFIERDFLEDGFKQLIHNNTIQGATSNPSIFEQSITNSQAYTQQIDMLQANNEKRIYEELAIADIKRAANLMQELYDDNSNNGFVSIEVDPFYCDDAKATIEEGERLYQAIGCDNVMIKVPATNAGYIAMQELTSKGISVNATLIFSDKQAIECAKALDAGIKQSNQDTKAVISVFVSRFDRALDEELEHLGVTPSKTGIINATKCYHEIEKFENPNIRTLFASTGVKGDKLPVSYYVDNLVYPHSVNTAPLGTINGYIQNDIFKKSDILSEQECDEYFDTLLTHKIDINKVSQTLLVDGLEAFKVSFANMLKKLKR